jgi:uncharacterized membrane protein YphA (DoxX/SURF4 family)
MRIELEDTPQAHLVSLTQACLRMVLGGIVLLHGFEKLQHPDVYEALLQRAGVFEAALFAKGVLALELLAGACLLLGRYTRTAAGLGLVDLACEVALGFALGELDLANPVTLEPAALILAASCFFMVVGGGPFALDHWFKERRRLRAIARDDIWSRPPYVSHR